MMAKISYFLIKQEFWWLKAELCAQSNLTLSERSRCTRNKRSLVI